MALLGSIATLRAQVPDRDQFAAAFAYLADLDRADSAIRRRLAAMAAGVTERVELPGGSFALEQVYEARRRPDGFFESHRRYIDVQVIVEGEELMEVVELSRATVSEPYVEERDFIKYADLAGASVLRVRAGEAAIFFPVDVHMPALRVPDGSAMVRKTVIKVPVAG